MVTGVPRSTHLKAVQQVAACLGAFAAILGDGSVVTWGDAYGGGWSGSVQDQLRDVRSIRGFNRSFAAVRADGSVVTWGYADAAGDSADFRDLLMPDLRTQPT